MNKIPSFQFYPGDWMKDPAIRQCSLAARGMWTDMLCLMFESSRRGYLQQANGQPLSHAHLARMTGCASDEAAHLLQELEDAGVFSRTEHGVIYSRRIVRDERKRDLCREAGKRGGNPTLKGSYKGGLKGMSKRNATPSSSSSTSKQESTFVDSKPLEKEPVELPVWLPRPAWTAYLEMRKRKRAAPTDNAVRLVLRELERLRAEGDDVSQVLEQSIRSNWTDVYGLKKPGGGNGSSQGNSGGNVGGAIGRVARTQSGFDKAAESFGWQSADETDEAAGSAVPPAGVRGHDSADVHPPVRTIDAAVRSRAG